MSNKPLKDSVKENVATPARVSFRMRIFQSYILVAFFAFVVLAISAKLSPYYVWDLPVLRFIQSLHYPLISPLLTWTSWPGFFPQAIFFLIAGFSFLWWSGLRWEASTLFISASFSTLLVEILKVLVGRLRPSNIAYVAQIIHSRSFPSGHVVSYTVALGFIFFLSQTIFKKKSQRTVLGIIFLLPIILIGPSRVFLGEHWPSDTLGAYLLGSGLLFLTILFYRWGKSRYFVKQPVLPPTPSKLN